MLPNHPVSSAVDHVQNQWGPLTVFTQNPLIALDNTIPEQDMRRIDMGRNTYLFVGNERGGHVAAISFIDSTPLGSATICGLPVIAWMIQDITAE